jgi:hypothetical protein
MLEFDPIGHLYRLDGKIIPSVTQILAEAGFVDSQWFTTESQDRGTMVHRGIHTHELGLLEDPPAEFQGYLKAWETFKLASDFIVGWTEHMMVSETYRFAGTADCLGTFAAQHIRDKDGGEVHYPDRLALIDFKTSESERPWWRLQLAAYHILCDEPNRGRYSLRLREDGTYRLTEYPRKTLREDRAIFIAALNCFQWKENNR